MLTMRYPTNKFLSDEERVAFYTAYVNGVNWSEERLAHNPSSSTFSKPENRKRSINQNETLSVEQYENIREKLEELESAARELASFYESIALAEYQAPDEQSKAYHRVMFDLKTSSEVTTDKSFDSLAKELKETASYCHMRRQNMSKNPDAYARSKFPLADTRSRIENSLQRLEELTHARQKVLKRVAKTPKSEAELNGLQKFVLRVNSLTVRAVKRGLLSRALFQGQADEIRTRINIANTLGKFHDSSAASIYQRQNATRKTSGNGDPRLTRSDSFSYAGNPTSSVFSAPNPKQRPEPKPRPQSCEFKLRK